MYVTPALAAKTDIVVLLNGDTVTGEVKSLDFGSLRFSTDSMGTVQIDWEDIVALNSKQSLQVENVDGTRYFGSVEPGTEEYQILVVTNSGPVEVSMRRIVRMTPIETDERWWQRVDGSLSFGFNTQKGSEVSTLNLAFDASYRTLNWLAGVTVNSAITDQPSEETTMRQSVGLNYQRLRPNRWFTGWFASWETNDELGINSRVLAGGGLGRYIIQTNENQLSAVAGLVGTRESFIGETESTVNAEGLIQVKYLHRSLNPESFISFTTNLYPLLEDLSSYRAESDLTYRHEFIEDLFFDLTVYRSYLSDPPEGAVGTDYGVTTSIGYSF
jgi:putative salt-induced outer membrane protein YdiY